MGIARQWDGQHDEKCEDPEFNNSINCLCLDRFIDAHTATPRNLHVLIVKENGLVVHAAAYATHAAAKAGWVDFIAEAASPETELYEELLELSLKCERDVTTTARDLIEYGISEIDLIEWWVNRPSTWGNEARFYEVKDMR